MPQVRGQRRLRLGDLPTERLERHLLGLRTTAHALVEGVQGGELLRREFEVEDVEVLRDALRAHGLGDRRASLLQVPPQHHLRWRLAVRLGDILDRRVVKGATGAPVAPVDGDPADRRPRLCHGPLGLVLPLDVRLLEVGVDLDLVDGRHDLRAFPSARRWDGMKLLTPIARTRPSARSRSSAR